MLNPVATVRCHDDRTVRWLTSFPQMPATGHWPHIELRGPFERRIWPIVPSQPGQLAESVEK